MVVQHCRHVSSEDGILLFGDARSLQNWRVTEVGIEMVQQVDSELSLEINCANMDLCRIYRQLVEGDFLAV